MKMTAMFPEDKVFIGISPIAWCNDDDPDIGGECTFEQIVSVMALAGYAGCEAGNKFPKNPDKCKAALNLRRLSPASMFHLTHLATKPYEKNEQEYLPLLQYLQAIGAPCINVCELSYSIHQRLDKPIYGEKPVLRDEEWKQMVAGLKKFGKLANEHGIKMCYHHHLGTVVHTPEEMDRLLNDVNDDLLSLCFDTAHFEYFDIDSAKMTRKYASRIGHVHLKDVRKNILQKTREENLSFMDSVVQGVFTVPGDGDSDFLPIFEILAGSGYEGWLLIEADQDPTAGEPLAYAIAGREYLRKVTGL